MIPLEKIPDHIKQQQNELQIPKEEIEKSGAILEQNNTDIQTLEVYKKLEEELEKYGFSMDSPHKLVSVLLVINQIGCSIVVNRLTISYKIDSYRKSKDQP